MVASTRLRPRRCKSSKAARRRSVRGKETFGATVVRQDQENQLCNTCHRARGVDLDLICEHHRGPRHEDGRIKGRIHVSTRQRAEKIQNTLLRKGRLYMLQKSCAVQISPYPLFCQVTRSISAVPSALQRFMSAMRMWTSAVCLSGSREAIRSPKDLRQRILASIRLRT